MSHELMLPITRALYGPDHPSRKPSSPQRENKEHFVRVHNYVSEKTLAAVARAFPKSKTATLLARRRRANVG